MHLVWWPKKSEVVIGRYFFCLSMPLSLDSIKRLVVRKILEFAVSTLLGLPTAVHPENVVDFSEHVCFSSKCFVCAQTGKSFSIR